MSFVVFGIKQTVLLFVLLLLENKSINVTKSFKLLGINVDDELKFDKHVKKLCQNISRKISAFSRGAPYIDEKRGEILYHTFIMSNILA